MHQVTKFENMPITNGIRYEKKQNCKMTAKQTREMSVLIKSRKWNYSLGEEESNYGIGLCMEKCSFEKIGSNK